MCHCYHIWSKELLMQVKNVDDLHGGQRSSEVKCGKLCALVTIFCQKNCWCKLRLMMTFTEVKGHQRSNVVKYALWLSVWSKELLMQVKGFGMGPLLVLVSPCFRENVFVTCKIGSFLCSLDTSEKRNCFLFWKSNFKMALIWKKYYFWPTFHNF